jgi:gas vesicle protein GvpL/GvpF
VERIVSEVFEDVRDRARHVVRGMLLEELVRRLTDEDPAGAVPEQVVERPTSLASVEEELAGLEKELDQLVATTGEEIPEGSSLYLYAVVPSADARRVLMPEGVVPGRTVEAIEDGELAAVVSHVDASWISADAADADAVAGIARRHDDVLTAPAQQATVVPFRLGTVCQSSADVHRLLTAERDRLYDLVNELYDRDEFGVQVVVAEDEAEPTAPADADEAGVTYLQRKVDQRRESERQWQAARRAAEAIHERLAGLAVRWQAVPSRSGRPALVSNGSYLVERRRADEFLSEAEGLRAEHAESGVSIRVTGPWPPYSFTELDANGLDG